MIKKTLLLKVFVFTMYESLAQVGVNLITNPSFEDIDSCYGNFSGIGDDVFQIINCTGWSNPIASSSDHFCGNPRTNSPFIGNPEMYQEPHSGSCMAGILINGGIILNYREYLQNELATPLLAGLWYEISFYVSPAHEECSSSQFGVKFFTTSYHNLNQLWLTDYIPDAVNEHTLFVPDTMNWQKITMKYLANGTEKYMVFGSFQDSSKISYSLPCDSTFWEDNWRGIGNYFFIDDVSVIEIEPELSIPNVFTPNGDGVNDTFVIDAKGIQSWRCIIYNRWGQQVAILHPQVNIWNGAEHSTGTYYYVFQSADISKSGIITLIRNP